VAVGDRVAVVGVRSSADSAVQATGLRFTHRVQ
jgi:hypothetical protein